LKITQIQLPLYKAVLHLGNIEFIQKGDVTEVQNPDGFFSISFFFSFGISFKK